MDKTTNHKDIGILKRLFTFNNYTRGQALWLPKGWIMFNNIQQLIKCVLKSCKYQEVSSPLLGNKDLWTKTGHIDKYSENMFTTIDGNVIKPMNCPIHIKILDHLYTYKSLLPIKILEFNRCYRKEDSGAISGLLRLVGFTQDDSHILCKTEQILDITRIFLNNLKKIYKALGINTNQIKYRLSIAKSETYNGTEDNRKLAYSTIVNTLNQLNLEYYESDEGAFYAHKIDIILFDALRREWQLGTIQYDFLILRNTKFTLRNNDNYDNTMIIHHATLGTIERFIGIYLENTKKISHVINPYVCAILTTMKNDIIDKYIEQLINYKPWLLTSDLIDIYNNSDDIRTKVSKVAHLDYEYIIFVGALECSSSILTIKPHKKSQYTQEYMSFLDQIERDFYEERYTIR